MRAAGLWLVAAIGCTGAAASPAPDAAVAADITQTLDTPDALQDAAAPANDSLSDAATATIADTVVTDAAVDLGDAPTCFHGQPPADGQAYLDIPKPDSSACTLPPVANTKGEPTLDFEVGVRNTSTGVWTPYQDGGWAVLTIGPQGAAMLLLDVRIALPAGTSEQVKAHLNHQAFSGCSPMPQSPEAIQAGASLEKEGSWWVTASSQWEPFVMANETAKICDTWVRLDVALILDKTAQWGRKQVHLRLVDAK